MNKTGLSQAMNPCFSSVLLDHNIREDVPVRTNVARIPTSGDFAKSYGVNYIFDVCPLKGLTNVVKPDKDCLVPRCGRCHGFPDWHSAVKGTTWTCGVCHHKNAMQRRVLCPNHDGYDICLSKKDKPLFLFMFQSDVFFGSEVVRKGIGEVLHKWCETFETDLAIVGVGSNIVCLDLKIPRAYVYVDPEDMIVPVCASSDAKVQRALAGLQPTLESENGCFLRTVLSCLKVLNRKNICLCVFASQMSGDKQLFKEMKHTFAQFNVSGQLFTRKHLQCAKAARLFDRIRVIDEDSAHLIAPQLSSFLNSTVLFEPRIVLHFDSSLFEIESAYASRKVTNSPLVDLPLIDGQSSVAFEIGPTRVITASSVHFQVSIEGVRVDGMRVLRVISHTMKTTGAVDQFDGVVFGCFLARKHAHQTLKETPLESYRDHREECIELISKWSAKGQYRRSIPEVFRDVPLLMFALEVCDMYRSDASEIEQVAASVNMTGLSLELLRRTLYPLFIIPPLTFPHRLERLSSGSFKLLIFIRAFDGIAVSIDGSATDEDIQKATERFNVPITVYTTPDVAVKYLIEERGCSFSLYAEKMEVEVNGRRF